MLHSIKNSTHSSLVNWQPWSLLIISGRAFVNPFFKAIVDPIVPLPYSENKNVQMLLQIEGVSWNGKKPIGNPNAPKLQGNNTADSVIEDRR